MKIAHLILTHKNPEQTERLIDALQHPGFDFYLHIDKKTDAAPFLHLTHKKNVYIVQQRAKVYWAAYGTIQATLNGFKEILQKEYAYINVISAQDFPIKTAEQVYQTIMAGQGKEFITCESIEDEWKEAAIRVTQYHLINWQIPGRHRLEKIINRLLPPRKFPLGYQLVGRANWFTLTPAAAQYVLDFLKKHPEVVRYFKYCWGADEFLFSTILYNNPDYKSRIVPNLVYVDWTGQKQGHPRILLAGDFEKLKNSDKLFARKFDITVDASIISMLERAIGNRQLTTDNRQ